MDLAITTLLLLTALICTIRTRFIQFRRFGSAMRCFSAESTGKGAVSPFQAAATSLAATIGTGNIAGVAGAILLGGPGTVFWMWISALVGMAAKYTEIFFGMRYRTENVIGPMAYIEHGLEHRWQPMAFAYAGFCAIACLTMGNLVQVNTVAEAAVSLFHSLPSVSRIPNVLVCAAVGGVTALAVGLVEYGGAKRVGRVAALLVPFMSLLYLLGAGVLLWVNRSRLLPAFHAIFSDVFNPKAFLVGISRGTFSHEAGLGTAAIAHGYAATDNNHRQALYGIFEVFFDTILICTVTALAVLVSGIPLVSIGEARNSALVIDAFATFFGASAAAAGISISLLLFAFSSIISFSLYGSFCATYLFGTAGGKMYRVLFLPLLIIGACTRVTVVWQLAEWCNMALAVINSAALLGLLFRPQRSHEYTIKTIL